MAFVPRRILVITAGLIGVLALAVLAGWGLGLIRFGQILPGRVTDHYAAHDGWELACDTATDGSDPRCYVQYVDVYRSRPDFAAAMVEIVMRKGAQGRPDPHVRFDIEPGLDLGKGRLEIATADGVVPVDLSTCRKNSCLFSGPDGRALLDIWRRGTELRLTILEKRGEAVQLAWPLSGMGPLLDAFARARRARDLP